MNLHIGSPDESEVTKPKHDLVTQVPLDGDRLERYVGIGAELSKSIKDVLIQFLRSNISTFAWSIDDLKGIDPNDTCHELNVDPTYKPIKQKRQKLSTERAQAVNN